MTQPYIQLNTEAKEVQQLNSGGLTKEATTGPNSLFSTD